MQPGSSSAILAIAVILAGVLVAAAIIAAPYFSPEGEHVARAYAACKSNGALTEPLAVEA